MRMGGMPASQLMAASLFNKGEDPIGLFLDDLKRTRKLGEKDSDDDEIEEWAEERSDNRSVVGKKLHGITLDNSGDGEEDNSKVASSLSTIQQEDWLT